MKRALAVDDNATMEQRTVDITTTGRRTGQPRRIEIVFYRLDEDIYLSGIPAPLRRRWLLNLEANPDFVFHLKHGVMADLPAVATVITDPGERRRILSPFVDQFNRRNAGTQWPDAVLDEWVAGSPLARVEFPDAGRRSETKAEYYQSEPAARGAGRPSRKPWAASASSSMTSARSSVCSTPSATAVMPKA